VGQMTNNLMDSINNVNNHFRKLENQMAETMALKVQKEQDAMQRDIQLNEMTKQIVKNTSVLPEMVGLIRENNKINIEMLELHKEMLNVLKAQTEEEAKNIVWDVAEKAKKANETISSVMSLMKFGMKLVETMF
jgi:membrane-associated HD superfamily phosphohydrolase